MKRARATKRAAAKISWSTIPRPGDVGLDLPAGASASVLAPADYHPVEMEPAAEPTKPRRAAARARARKPVHA